MNCSRNKHVLASALLVIAFVLHFSEAIFAQDLDPSARTHLSDVLNKPLSPRAAALGNAFVAMKDDPNTLFSNPAAISSVVIDSERENEIAVSYSHYVLDINEGAVVYEHPVPESFLFAGDFAAGVQYFSGGTSTEATSTGEQLGPSVLVMLHYFWHIQVLHRMA